MIPPPFDNFKPNFSIEYSDTNPTKLRIAEAIFIKTANPFINVKYNELLDFLKLF